MSENTNSRNIGIDALRAVLMFFIILGHLMNAAQTRLLQTNTFDDKYIVFPFITAFTCVAVNCFFLISGYYGIRNNYSKLVKIVLVTYFFYYLFNLSYLLMGFETVSIDMIKGFIFPVRQYWFIFVYIVLSLIAPYVNKTLDMISINEEKRLLAILLSLYCGYTFVLKDAVLGANDGYSLSFAIILYMTGHYLKNKENEGQFCIRYPLFKYLLLSGITGIIVVFMIKTHKQSYAWDMFSYNNPLVFLASICLFYSFKDCTYKFKQLSNLGGYALYIYVFHSTSVFAASYKTLIITIRNYGMFYLFTFIIVLSLLLFVGGGILGEGIQLVV